MKQSKKECILLQSVKKKERKNMRSKNILPPTMKQNRSRRNSFTEGGQAAERARSRKCMAEQKVHGGAGSAW